MKRNFKSFFIISIFLFAAGAAAVSDTYVWTGNTSTVFTTAGNWDNTPNSNDGLPDIYIIPESPSGNRYPKLTADYNPSDNSQINIESGAELDMNNRTIGATCVLSVTGILKLTGTNAQKALFGPGGKIILQNGSTVEYNPGSTDAVFGGPYKNLVLKRSITAASLSVHGTTAVNTAATITAPTQTYTGAVSVNADTIFEAGTALTFESAVFGSLKNIVIKGKDITFNSVVSAVDLTVMNKNGGTLTIKKNITVSNSLIQKDMSPPYSPLGPVVIDSDSDVTITAPKQVYNGAVTLEANTTFSAGAPSGLLALQFEKAVASPAHKNIVLETVTSTGIKTEQSVSAGKITVRNGTGNSSRWESYGIVSAEDDIEVSGVWQHSASGNITAKGNVKAGTFKQTTPGSTLVFAGNDTQTLEVGSSSQIQRLKNTKSLRLNSDIKIIETFENNGSFAHNDKTVTFNSPFSKISGTKEPTFSNLTIASGANLKLDRPTVKINGVFTNNGTFDHNNKTVIFNGLTSKIAGSTETAFYNLTVDDSRILHLDQNIVIAAAFKNGGIFKALGKTVTIDPASAAANIQGTNTATDTEFASLSWLGAGGKTLKIDGRIKVDGNLKLEGSGTDDNDLLTIQGGTNSSGIALTVANTATGKYLKVRTNIDITTDSYKYTADSSKPYTVSGDPEIGIDNPKNWIFTNYLGSLTWTGNTDNNWTEKNNWSPPVGVPGINTDATIPAGIQASKYPKLTANVNAKTITLAPGAKLDLADYIITKSTSVSDFTPITNNGTLRMKGTSSLTDPKGQKEWLESTVPANKITHGANSVIEYYSTANNPLWQGPYQNLTVSEGRTSLTPIIPGSGSTAADLIVEKTFTVAADAGNNFIVTANSQLYKQTVSLRKKTIFSSFGGTGTVFKGSVSASGIDITFSGNGLIQTERTVTAKDIIVNAGANTWTSSGTITAHNITVSRNWISSADVTSSGNITANGWTAKNVSLKGNLTAAQFDQTGGTLKFNGTGTPEQELKFTGAGDKNINNLIIDNGVSSPASNANVKLLSDITVKENFTNKGTFNADSGTTVKLDNSNNHAITGTNTANDTKFHTLSLRAAGGKTLTINKKITVADLDISGSSAASKLTVKGAGEITLTADYTAVPPSSPLPSPPPAGYFLNVCLNIPIADGYTYTVRNSTPANNSGIPILSGSPENWIFEDYSGTLTWTAGAASPTDKTKWNNPKNWSPNCTPGIDTEAIIPVVNPYPILTANVNAKTVTVDSGAQLNLAGFVITDTSNTARLINNGLLKMTGTSAQKAWFEQTAPTDQISLGTDSTVQYQSGSTDAVFSGPYENLMVQRSITAPSLLTVNKKTTVNAAATITAPTQSYTGVVTVNADTEFDASTALTFKDTVTGSKKIKLSGSGSTNIGNNITLTGTGGSIEQTGSGSVIIGDASVLPSKITVTARTQTYSGSVIVKTDAEFNAQTSLTFTSSASLTAQGRNIDFVVSNDSTVTLPTLTVADAVSPAVANSLVKIASKTGNSFLTVTGTTEIQTLTTRPGAKVEIAFPKQEYRGEVKAENNTVFTASTSLLFAGTTSLSSTSPQKDVELKSSDVEIRGSVDVNGLYVQASEKIILKGAVKLSNKFEQTGNAAVQIGAPITDGAGTGLPLNGISFASKNLYLVVTPPATTTFDPSPSAVTKPDDCTIFVAGNLTLKNELKCANFVLFGGTVTFGVPNIGITTEVNGTKGDIVLFGPQYKAEDMTTDDPSDTAGLFRYIHSGRTGIATSPNGYSARSSLAQLPAALPDGTALPKETDPAPFFSGAFANLGGQTLKAGKNFYVNGVTTLNPSGTWTLDIPDNDDATLAFAEAYFTTVSNCIVKTNGHLSTSAFVAAAEKCTVTSSSSWKKDRLTIVEAYTYSDDTIYVRFNMDVENSKGEIARAINSGNIKFNNGMIPFKEALAVTVSGGQKIPGATLPNGDVHEFFLRTNSWRQQRWNTDATGMYAGSNQSTDRGGAQPYASASGKDPVHQNTKPNLWIPKATSSIYAAVRDKYKNRIRHYAVGAADTSGDNKKIYGDVKDHCPPVLAAVYVGQEAHVQALNPVNQPKYDAHNFIEFRYSEPVFIDGISDNGAIASGIGYVRATDTIGNIETGSGGTITAVKGLASFSNGKLITGIRPGATSGSVHAVYRTAAMRVTTPLPPGSPSGRECRVRVSVAGWVEGAVSVPIGGSSTPVHNWVGYIDQSEAPSGSALPVYTEPSPNPQNKANVRTREPTSSTPLKNWEKLDAQFVPKIYASSAVGLAEVSGWDTSPPVLAVIAKEKAAWLASNPEKEAAVYSTSSHLADRMEFHFFDNTPPDHTESGYWWETAEGWRKNDAPPSFPNERYDSYGGSRFNTGTNGNTRTTGGIRACTIADSIDAFAFTHTQSGYNAELQKFKTSGTYTYSQKAENEALFGLIPSGYSEYDNLYLQLRIPSSAFPVTEPFAIGYDQNQGFITDLAGNKMKPFGSAGSTFGFPPNIALTVAPVGSKKAYVLFTCQIDTKPATLANIPKNLMIENGLGVNIDSTVPAVVRTDSKRGTGIIVTLDNEVQYDSLATARIKIQNTSPPQPMAIKSYLSGYPAVIGHKHSLSDFAVNVVRPLFAYDQKAFDGGNIGFSSQNLYGDGSYAMRLFDGSGAPGNTVLEKEDITLSVAVENVEPAQMPSVLKMFIDNTPIPSSVSKEFNELTGLNSRVWLPDITPTIDPAFPAGVSSILPAISTQGNSCGTNEMISGTRSGSTNSYVFAIPNNPNSAGTLNYPAGSRVGFMFPMLNSLGAYITIDHDNDGTTPPVPLYALRLKDPNDPASIDLWSFDIASIKKQAGGVSILNNVINANTGEQTLIKVDTEKAGSLSVMVMTLDGDVLKVLHSGRVEKGEHIYKWDGRNANGEPVARGLYFIRIVGTDIDETRKVMAVRE